MSEDTSVYLRKKAEPLLPHRSYPSKEELAGKTEEEIKAIYQEIDSYNDSAYDSLGCKVISLTTTPSRQLEVLPWSDKPVPLTKEMLDEIIDFYNDEIASYQVKVSEIQEEMERHERRIVKVGYDLYKKIDEEIVGCKDSIKCFKEEMEELEYYRSRFSFLRQILSWKSRAERYELIYTKC